MTGPPYPFPPSTEAIPPFNWWQTVISQYANSATLTQMISNFFDAIDQTADFDAFFNLIWNIDTAQGYGLDVWGRIVGVQRILQIPGAIVYLDFEESAGTGTFGSGTFYSGATVTQNFILTDANFRTLIFAKALANISDGSTKSINAGLLSLFPGRGNAYVIDNNNMSMVYNFTFSLTVPELAIVQNSGALPRPAGVAVSIVTP